MRPRRQRARRVFLGTFFVLLGFLASAFALQVVSWWEENHDARLVQSILEDNPGALDNQALTDAVVEQVLALPTLSDGKPAVVVPIAERVAVPNDEEWEQLPKTSFRLEKTLSDHTLLDGKQLFRNVTLNPGNIRIGKDSRARFDVWLASTAPVVRGLHEAIDKVSTQELDYMIRKGVAPYVSYSRHVRTISEAERERVTKSLEELRARLGVLGATETEIESTVADTKDFDPSALVANAFCYATRSRDDNIYFGDLRSMPQARQTAEVYYATVMRMYDEMLHFFRDCGTLDEAQHRGLLDGLEPKLARYHL